MNILIVNELQGKFKVSGINVVVNEISLFLSRNNNVNLLTKGKCNNKEPTRNLIAVPNLYFLLKFLRKNIRKFDIVNVHNYYSIASAFTIYFCSKNGVPCVFTPHYHGIRGTKKGLFKFIYDLHFHLFGKRMFRDSNKVICVSDYEKQIVQKTNPLVEDSKLLVVPNGVYEINTNVSLKTLKNDKISLLSVGNLSEAKGFHFIINAIPMLKKHFKSVKLTIVGDGYFKDDLIKLIDDLGVKENVTFKSNLSEDTLKKEYIKADIFLLLSYSEAYGLVVAEALALGTPSIVYNIRALNEFTSESGCFGIDHPQNPEELTDLIVKVHEMNVRVGPFSEKIRTWDKVAENYELIYYNLLKEVQNADK